MTWEDAAPLVGLMMGAWSAGWCAGYALLIFRKVTESAT